ncbi:hypothetical protein MEO_02256, partial [Candida albicans P94015]
PILTIPESSFDPASYNNLNTANITKSKSKSKSQSQILLYIIKLTRRSSIGLILFYILGLFIIKPLMELNVTRRKDYLDYIRGKLRDFYLKSITKVQYIPIVAIKNKQTGKLYSDAIIQTDNNNNNNKSSTNSTGDDDSDDRLGQNQLYKKLTKLSLLLTEGIRNYSTIELSNYKSINYSIKDLQNKSDLVYFNQNDLFVMDNGGGGGGVSSIMTTSGNTMKKKDLAVETKNEIRSIKGLYMSGQV